MKLIISRFLLIISTQWLIISTITNDTYVVWKKSFQSFHFHSSALASSLLLPQSQFHPKQFFKPNHKTERQKTGKNLVRRQGTITPEGIKRNKKLGILTKIRKYKGKNIYIYKEENSRKEDGIARLILHRRLRREKRKRNTGLDWKKESISATGWRANLYRAPLRIRRDINKRPWRENPTTTLPFKPRPPRASRATSHGCSRKYSFPFNLQARGVRIK